MLTTLWDTGKYKGFQKDPESRSSGSSTTRPAQVRFGSSRTRPEPRNVDRRHRAPGRAVPRPLRAALRRGAGADREGKARAGSAAPAARRGPPRRPPGRPPCPAAAAVGRRPAPAAAAAGPARPLEFGLDGSGGARDAEIGALMKNKNITFDATGVADLKAGKIDPRVVALLTHVSKKHKSSSRACAPTTRADGGRLDLQPLARPRRRHRLDRRRDRAPGSPAARELASELAEVSSDTGRTRSARRSRSRAGLLLRRRAPEPHPHRLQAGAAVGLEAAGRRRGGRSGARRRPPPRPPSAAAPPEAAVAQAAAVAVPGRRPRRSPCRRAVRGCRRPRRPRPHGTAASSRRRAEGGRVRRRRPGPAARHATDAFLGRRLGQARRAGRAAGGRRRGGGRPAAAGLTSPRCPTSTPGTARRRSRSRPGWRRWRRSAGCRASCR